VMRQPPLPEQHAPWTAAHGEVGQTVPTPRKLLAPVQPVPIDMEQKPAALQQAPTSAWQGWGVQVGTAEVDGRLRPGPVVSDQAQMLEQPAARWAEHGSGVQVVDEGLNTPNEPGRHPLGIVSAQAPAPLGQQARSWAVQGLVGEQVVPLPW